MEQLSRNPTAGSSLGPYIGREIITRMGGDIALESSAAGSKVLRVSLAATSGRDLSELAWSLGYASAR